MAGPYRALSGEEVRAALASLPGWEEARTPEGVPALRRTFRFARYLDGAAFVRAVADLAERENHHPEILLGFKQAAVSWWTHKTRGISDRDAALAASTQTLHDRSVSGGCAES